MALYLGHIKELLLISLDMIMTLTTSQQGGLDCQGSTPPATAQGGKTGSGATSQEAGRRPAHAVLQSLNDP